MIAVAHLVFDYFINIFSNGFFNGSKVLSTSYLRDFDTPLGTLGQKGGEGGTFNFSFKKIFFSFLGVSLDIYIHIELFKDYFLSY